MSQPQTPNLTLPYIASAQAQKHITHNEALRIIDAIVHIAVFDRDLATPPVTSTDGARYLVAASPTGAWTGHTNHIAAFQDGAWAFYAPAEGWLAWIADEDLLVAWSGAAWVAAVAQPTLNPTPLIGINATADPTNRLTVSAPATLFNHDGAGHQLKLNKAAAADTTSLLFQTGFSGRAELGTTGSDSLQIKVSPDGSAWTVALAVDGANGNIGVGTTNPSKPFEVVRTGIQADVTATTYGVNGGGILHGRFARGTESAPLPVLANDIVAGIGGRAYHAGGAFQASSPAAIHWIAAEDQVPGAFGSYLRFLTTAVGSATRREVVRFAANGGVGIGTQGDPDRPLVVSSALNPLPAGNASMMIVGGSNKERFELRSYGSDPVFQSKKSGGTLAAPTAAPNGSLLFALGGSGHNGTDFVTGNLGLFAIRTSEAWTPTANGTVMIFETTNLGAVARTERLRIDSAGHTVPGADNLYSLGSATRRWSAVHAVNGTIQTSDARDKTILDRVRPERAAAAIDAIDPVLFHWTDPARDGVDRITAPSFDEADPIEAPRPAADPRRHAGFIAQEIKLGLDHAGIDCAAWGLDDPADPASRQWLRPDQLLPLVWAALKDTRQRLATLEARRDPSYGPPGAHVAAVGHSPTTALGLLLHASPSALVL